MFFLQMKPSRKVHNALVGGKDLKLPWSMVEGASWFQAVNWRNNKFKIVQKTLIDDIKLREDNDPKFTSKSTTELLKQSKIHDMTSTQLKCFGIT